MKIEHKYKLGFPKVGLARGKSKCRVCKEAILKDENYAHYWIIDECSHGYVNGKPLCFNIEMKVCKNCIPFILKAYENKPCIKHLREILEKMRPKKTRYQIARGIKTETDEWLEKNKITGVKI